MKMNVQSIVENVLVEDACSVWRLYSHNEFGYSDGASSEKYLRKVLQKAADLSTRSEELGDHIKDWPSEYHLTTKRSQLLSGFSFDPSLKVLEVGCGCGAITRYLGETFNEVVSVEGNINRARIAGQRCRDLESVSIICGPFHEVKFTQKFDIIFCVGVFEYSASFIDAEDPYDAALKYFSSMLSPDGMVVIAIENQFGLKYFCSAREDHLGTMFEGLEGYHRNPNKVRTFGKVELRNQLNKYFKEIEFYYPYPDYKIPDCVISDQFLSSGRAGELVSQIRSRDYTGDTRALWDESATTLELARNRMMDFFSNSFLVFAGLDKLKGVRFNQLAIMYSSGRNSTYSTRTRIFQDNGNATRVEKRKVHRHNDHRQTPLMLVDSESKWVDSFSLLTQMLLRSHERNPDITGLFAPVKRWTNMLLNESRTENGVRWLDGAHLDSIWANAYFIDDECVLVDREWIWHEPIRLNVVIIRAIFDFLARIEMSTSLSSALSLRRGKDMIHAIARTLDIELSEEDFANFIYIETEIAYIVTNISRRKQSLYLRWFLTDRPTCRLFRRIDPIAKQLLSRVRAKIENFF